MAAFPSINLAFPASTQLLHPLPVPVNPLPIKFVLVPIQPVPVPFTASPHCPPLPSIETIWNNFAPPPPTGPVQPNGQTIWNNFAMGPVQPNGETISNNSVTPPSGPPKIETVHSWTHENTRTMLRLMDENLSYQEIAQQMGNGLKADDIRYRLHNLKKENQPLAVFRGTLHNQIYQRGRLLLTYDAHFGRSLRGSGRFKWDITNTRQMLDMLGRNFSYSQISNFLGGSGSQCITHRIRVLKNKGILPPSTTKINYLAVYNLYLQQQTD